MDEKRRVAAVAAYRLAKKRIEDDPALVRMIQEASPAWSGHLIDLVAHGAYVFYMDDLATNPKTDRDKSRRDIRAAAKKLAALLRQTPWPDLALQEVKIGHDEQARPLAVYLEWLAARAAVGDIPPGLPRGQSKTDFKGFMLLHIKNTLRQNGLAVPEDRIIPCTVAIARAVLDDPAIERGNVKKL